MRCKVLKKFGHRGVLQIPGSIIDVPEGMLLKMSGYVQAIATADSYPPTDWKPTPKVRLTEAGELRTQGVFDDLAGEIIKLTTDNLPLQRKLLSECVGRYSGPHLKALKEQWEERAAIMQYDGGMSKEEAELAAAKHLRLEAFIDELINPLCG